MSSRGAFSTQKISALNGDDERDYNSSIWTTVRINALLDEIDNGKDIKGLHNSPFKDNDVNLKRANLPFEYTPEEWNELVKCKEDIIYFAENYCFIQSEEGRMLIKEAGGLRDFQIEILRSFQANKYNILMASRQVGKSVTSGIFILWFSLFHAEKTTLLVADNFTTTRELLDKFRIGLDGLPFFMKPGIKLINTGNIRFDNDSRIVGRTTTKKSGIGLSVNLLYIDEFAHIDPTKLNDFYRAVFPTISADPTARIIITSTPNGKNKFHDIWSDAVNGVNTYVPLRVDWWQIPGRDEQWKQDTIANLGSEEDFNQEYGLQFFSSDQLLLNSTELKRLENIKVGYRNSRFALSQSRMFINDRFFLHPKYADRSITDFRVDTANYVFSIDTADGVGRDFSVLNIYKMVNLPVKELLKRKEAVRNELDTVSLVQIAVLKSNDLDINQFAAAIEVVTYEIFNPDRVRIVLEMNYKGESIHNRLSEHPEYWDAQFVHSKHTDNAVAPKLGIRLGPTNKAKYCDSFKSRISASHIIPNEYFTIEELGAFGKSKNGTYRGQNGNDDLAMTCINLVPFFDSSQFWDMAVETYESAPEEYRKQVEEELFSLFRNGNPRKTFDFDEIKKMNNKSGGDWKKGMKSNVFDLSTLNHIQNLRDRFFRE